MRRPLIPFVVSYIYGIVAAELFRYFPVTVSLVSVLLVTLVVYLSRVNTPLPPFIKRREYMLKSWMTGLIITAATIGFFYMLYSNSIPSDDISYYSTGEKMTVIGMIYEPANFSSTKVTTHVRAMKVIKGEVESQVSGRIRLTVYDPGVVLSYGDIIRFTGRLRIIRGFKNPGLFDYSEYVARKGVRTGIGIGKKDNIFKIGEGGSSLLRRIYGWREEIRLSIVKGLSGPSSAILQAMVVGAMGDITPEVRDNFTAAGVTHILSISGSHLGFVTLIVFFIIRYTLIYLPYRILLRISLYTTPSKIAAFCTFPPIIFYTLLSGGEVATVRSLIMALVYLTAILIERKNDPVNTFVAAVLIVLLWNPQALFDISFQLSYMAVLSMILVADISYKAEPAEEASGWLRRWSKMFTFLMFLILAATISTAPIVAHYYNQITWAGLISNMVIVPFVGFAVLPVGLFTALLVLISHTAVIPLAWLNEILLLLFYKLVCFFARFPMSVIYVPSPGILLIFTVYMFSLSLMFLKNLWAKILLSLSIFLLALSLCSEVLSRDKEGLMRITFLDVGQGDSALIEFQDGKVMLIDGGGTFSETFDIGRSVLAPYLWNSGTRKVDYVVNTHPQIDHVEGLTYITDKFAIGEVWTNGTRGPASRDFDKIIQDKGIKQRTVHRGMEDMIIGGCRVNIINPPEGREANRYTVNNRSIVMRLSCKDLSLLFTGDIEVKVMKDIAALRRPLESKVIKVPHHGSGGSVEENFISEVKPEVAVISVGYQNIYHHPSHEAISAYERIGALVCRTDEDGAVIIEARDGKIRIKTYEDMVLKEADFIDLRLLPMTELSNIYKLWGN